jgi:hypothetical protein
MKILTIGKVARYRMFIRNYWFCKSEDRRILLIVEKSLQGYDQHIIQIGLLGFVFCIMWERTFKK